MQCKLSSRPTFKPQLESLEARDLPSVAGVAVYFELQSVQQGIQTMQTQADAAKSNFNTQLGQDIKGGTSASIRADFTKIGAEIQSVRSLDSQISAELQGIQQAIPSLLGGDQVDHFVALQAFSQLNGINLLGFLSGFPTSGNSSTSLTSQEQNALSEANTVATSSTIPGPNGALANVSFWLGASNIGDVLS